jgi:hypothetical protein
MEAGWIKIYTTDQPYRAEIVVKLLESEEIQAVIMKRNDSAYVLIGDCEVFVKENDSNQAIEIIKNAVL